MKNKPNIVSCKLKNRKISAGLLPNNTTGIEFKIVDGHHDSRTISLPLRDVGTITRISLSHEATLALYGVLESYIRNVMPPEELNK